METLKLYLLEHLTEAQHSMRSILYLHTGLNESAHKIIKEAYKSSMERRSATIRIEKNAKAVPSAINVE